MIYYANDSFQEFEKNPYDNNKPYDDNWILVKLVDDDSFFSQTGKAGSHLFQFILSKKTVQWKYQLMDFIAYVSEWNKNIIVAVNNEDLKEAMDIYKNHSYKDSFLREYEKTVLIHTTDAFGEKYGMLV